MIRKMILLTLIGLTLSGCMFRTHKADVTQGNVFNNEQVSRIHAGMSESEVRSILGNPVLVNVFTPNKTIYIYTFQAGYGQLQEKVVTLTIIGGRVTDVAVK